MSESFIFYQSFKETIDLLPDNESKLKVFDALCVFGFTGEEIAIDYPLNLALHQMIASVKGAQRKRKIKSENGKKGGAPKGNRNASGKGAPKGNQNANKNKQQVVCFSDDRLFVLNGLTEPSGANQTTKNKLNDNVNDNDNVNVSLSLSLHDNDNTRVVCSDDAAPLGASSSQTNAIERAWLGEPYDDGTGNVYRDYQEDGIVGTVKLNE